MRKYTVKQLSTALREVEQRPCHDMVAALLHILRDGITSPEDLVVAGTEFSFGGENGRVVVCAIPTLEEVCENGDLIQYAGPFVVDGHDPETGEKVYADTEEMRTLVGTFLGREV